MRREDPLLASAEVGERLSQSVTERRLRQCLSARPEPETLALLYR